MATPTRALVDALRATAARLAAGDRFRWTHMGACVCGHLTQTLTALSPAEIHRRALGREGDWATQALEISELPAEHCQTSGLPLDDIFHRLLAVGLSPQDIAHLERLADPTVLRALPPERRATLSYRDPQDVVLYLTTWADQLAVRLGPPASQTSPVAPVPPVAQALQAPHALAA